ncbi:MAG: phosphonate ABC transporter, permease protein PhnE [Thioalkalivibrionaceae bacterium]
MINKYDSTAAESGPFKPQMDSMTADQSTRPTVHVRFSAGGTVPGYPTHWRRPHFIQSPIWRWLLYAAALAYLVIGLGSVDINLTRIMEGLPRAWRFVEGFLSPDFMSRGREIWAGILESLTMALTATVVGVLISVPIGLGAARNLAPLPVYMLCRGIIAISRAFQEIVIAILFVAMVGFGAFAGFLTLAFATIGFVAKLLAEDIEASSAEPIEAMRSTGAGWMQMVHFGVFPQVMPRLIGLSWYRLDINFRESAVIGIVGAGGIGSTLNTAINRYEYDSAAAILIVIIALVLAAEYASGYIRRLVQ